MKKFLSLIALLLSNAVLAGNAWYEGKVTNIITLSEDGSFTVYLDNPDIKNTCKSKRVNFKVVDMGVERTKLAFTMAITALTADRTWGVVVDLPTTVGTICNASSTASQGALIK